MVLRKVVSVSIALSFIIVLATGIWSYFTPYSRVVATLHTAFGVVFTAGVALHLKHNFRALKAYSKGKIILWIPVLMLLLVGAAYFQMEPFRALMDVGARFKAIQPQKISPSMYEVIEMNMDKDIAISVDVLRSEHYWHPQMAIWVEDENGNYLETLFVSKATAKRLFFGGRSKYNFKTFDQSKGASSDYRRVNALPVWSHKRGVQYADGLYVPSNEDHFPDAITGETITDNFKLLTSMDRSSKFRLKIELNVAFDDNEFYSEFDFPDDDVYHSGTGQLGQPSIVFDTLIDLEDGTKYYLMTLIGYDFQQIGKY